MKKTTVRCLLFLILALAAFLRLYKLGSDELTFDEGFYSFRSIGYLDYLESPYQTTPIQWLVPSKAEGFTPSLSSELAPNTVEGLADPSPPWWLKLSFHDHPPLFFLIQRASFSVLGDSLLASRLPSAILGTLSIYLLYLIARKLFGGNNLAGLASAAIGAVGLATVSVSRLGMMESVLFFFALANLYFFLNFLENKKYWWYFGITFGLALLTKYTAIFLIPLYLTYIFLTKNRALLKDKKLWSAVVLSLLILSPVITYNIQLYRTFGHFDFQLSYLLKQKTHWPLAQGFSGKNQEPFGNIGENLFTLFSAPFLIASAIGLGVSLTKIRARPGLLLTILLFIFTTVSLMLTGSAIRFAAFYIIPFSLLLGTLTTNAQGQQQRLLILALVGLTAYEIFFTAKTVFINPPDYGVAKLDKYFDSALGKGRPAGLPSHPNPHLNRVIQKYAAERPVTMEQTGLIYDDDLALSPTLWLFSRRQYYHGIPIMTASKFQETLKNSGPDVFNGLALYFIKADSAAPLNPLRQTDYGEQIEKLLQKNSQKPAAVITGNNNLPAFTVYKFSLK